MPTVGTNPKVIPTLIKKCINNILAKQYEKILGKGSMCFSALYIILKIKIVKRIIKPLLPKNPHSSPTVLKI
jgi:hypothetical protein